MRSGDVDLMDVEQFLAILSANEDKIRQLTKADLIRDVREALCHIHSIYSSKEWENSTDRLEVSSQIVWSIPSSLYRRIAAMNMRISGVIDKSNT